MKAFYFVLFGAVGAFNVLAAVLDFKWYTNYWLKNRRSRAKVRFCTGLAGVLLILYGIAVFAEWI